MGTHTADGCRLKGEDPLRKIAVHSFSRTSSLSVRSIDWRCLPSTMDSKIPARQPGRIDTDESVVAQMW